MERRSSTNRISKKRKQQTDREVVTTSVNLLAGGEQSVPTQRHDAHILNTISLSIDASSEAVKQLKDSGQGLERLKVTFFSNKKHENQAMMDAIVEYCRNNVTLIELIGFTKWISIKEPMHNVNYLIIQNSDFGSNGDLLSEWFPNIRYLRLQNIGGTANNRERLMKQTFKFLNNLWLDTSTFTSRYIRTFLAINTGLTKLHLEFNTKRTMLTKHFLTGIDATLKHLKTLTVVPTKSMVPSKKKSFKEPKLFQELEELNILGFYRTGCPFDILSYLQVSFENVQQLKIEIHNLNDVIIETIGAYVHLKILIISANIGLNFDHLKAIVNALPELKRIQIIKIENDKDLRDVDELIGFVNCFNQLNEIILKDSTPIMHTHLSTIQNQLVKSNWTVESGWNAVRIFKPELLYRE